VADEKKKMEKKKRRIKGDAFWKLQGFQKRIREFSEEMSEWEMKTAEENELYTDQINWVTGAIFDPNAEIKDSRVINAKVIGRLPHEIIREHKTMTEKLKKIDTDMVAFRNKLCEQLKVWPDMIDLQTGIVEDDKWDGIDPETETEDEE